MKVLVNWDLEILRDLSESSNVQRVKELNPIPSCCEHWL